MKTTMMIAMTILSMGFYCIANASTITVDTNYPSIGDYTTLLDAFTNANSGDTILVYPSQTTYTANLSVTKQLHIIGAGYGHDFSKDGVYPTKTTYINFAAGSEGSIIEGFEIPTIVIRSDNVVIRNNRITSSISVYANNTVIKSNECQLVTIQSGYNGNIIKQNKFIRTSGECIHIDSENEVTISNNILVTPKISSSNRGIFADPSTSMSIINNYIEAYCPIYCFEPVSGVALNNILNSTNINCKIEYANNLCNNASLSDNNGNILNTDLSTVFVDQSSNNYHLAADSPATGTGTNGDDMGIYGGTIPYIDNINLPEAVPSIIHLAVPRMVPTGSNTLNVTIEAKSGNGE